MANNPRPVVPGPCPECGGRRIPVECDTGMNLRLSTFSISRLYAVACLDCGYVSLYTDRDKLRKKFLPNR